MQTKKTVAFFSLLVLALGFLCNVKAAPTDTVAFQGAGVEIDLTFPEEAHPGENINLIVTITADSAAILRNFTAVINVLLINQSWLTIHNPTDTFPQSLPKDYILQLYLPLDASGPLQCSFYVNTTKSPDYLNIVKINATKVRAQTYSELLADYNTLKADYITLNSTYTNLNSNFMSLNSTYNSLIANYTTLNATYTSLLTKNSALQTSYDTLTSNYDTLQENLNTLQNTINNLQLNYTALEASRTGLQTLYNSALNTVNSWQTDYRTLNSTYNNLNAACNTLNATFNNLKGNYTALQEDLTNLTNGKNSELDSYKIVMAIFLAAVVGLIALIVYIKKKEPEPYMVIRKETVAVKPEEEKKE